MHHRPKSCEEGPNPNAAMLAYPLEKKAVFIYQKQGCREDRVKFFSEMHYNRTRASSHKLH